MAGIQQVGLRAVFDIGTFASNVNNYVHQITVLQRANQSLANSSGSMGVAVSAGIGAAIGSGAIQALQGLGNAVQGVGQQIFETLRFFEQLTFSLETLFAIQGVHAGTFDSVTDAIGETSQAAQEYLLFLQDLAIFSPFTTEQIATGNRLLQVYRFTKEEAAGLTRLLVDYASAAGTSAVQLDRVSLALGQIRTAGRLLARDALQLTEAGIPIYDFLSEYTDQSIQDITKLQEQGLIPARTVIEALVAGLDDFEGSGKRVSSTIAGLLSSLDDIRTISQRDLFKGIFGGVRSDLQEFVDQLTSPETRARIVVFGEEIGKIFGNMVAGARAMAKSVNEALSSLTPGFKEGVVIFAATAMGLTALIGVAGLLTVAISALVTPFSLVIAAMAGLVTLWVTNFARVQSVTVSFNNVASRVLQGVADAFEDLSRGVSISLSAASSYISDFAMDVASWGSNIVGSLAEGITQGVGLIADAINAVGDVITFLMKPGSPPRFLPDLDQWGTDAAQTYLDAWGEAEFDALNELGSSIGSLLQSMAGAGQIDVLSVPRIMAGTREEYAKAIDQIVKTGDVSEATLRRVQRAAGPAGDAVAQSLRAFVTYRNATGAVEDAQSRLNAVTQKYKDIITPIRAEMERVSELRSRLSEDNEIRNLQRLLARGGVQESLRQEAMARIEEIRTGRKLRGLEKEERAALSVADKELEAAEKAQEEARKQIELIEARIKVQTDANRLVEDELRILEQLRREEERRAKEAERLRKEQLEKQLKIAQLLLAEVKDTVGVFRAQYTLADDTATAIEKQNAALELQAILGRRIVRNDEAKELGIPQDELNRLRNIPVTLEDIGIKAKAAAADITEGIEGLGDIDLSGPFEELQTAIDGVRIKFDESRVALDNFITRVDETLPSFLKLRGEAGETSPILDTFGSILAGLGAGFLTSRLITVLSQMPKLIAGLSNPVGWVITGISLLASAYAGNWLDIRQHTGNAVDWVRDKTTELANNPAWGALADRLSGVRTELENFFEKGGLRQLVEEGGPLYGVANFITGVFIPAMQRLRDMIGQQLGPIFAPLTEGLSLENIVQVFGNIATLARDGLVALPGVIATVFGDMVSLVQERAPALIGAFLSWLPTLPLRIATGLVNAYTAMINWATEIYPAIASRMLDLGTAFLQWLGPLAGDAVVGLGKFLGAALRWIIGTAIPAVFRAALGFTRALLGFIGFAITELPGLLGRFIASFAGWVASEGIPGLAKAVLGMGSALLAFVTRGEEEVGPSLERFLSTINTWMDTYIYPALYSAMLEIGNGVLLGLYDAFGQENVDGFFAGVLTIFANIQSFFSTVMTWFGAAGDFFKGWFNAIASLVGDLITWGETSLLFFSGVAGAFNTAWDSVVAAVMDASQQFIGFMLELLSGWLLQAIKAAAALQAFLAPATEAAQAAFDTVTQYFGQVMVYVDGVLTYFEGLPALFLGYAVSIYTTITTEAAKWLLTLTAQLTIWGEAIATTITSFTQLVWDAALALGENVVNGIVQGLNNLVDAPRTALQGLLNNLLGGGQEDIEARSPSRLFAREIGEPIAAGIVEGINTFDPAATFRGLVGKAVSAFQSMGQGTTAETEDMSDDGTELVTKFSAEVAATFGRMSEDVVAAMSNLATQATALLTQLLASMLQSFQQFASYMHTEQSLLQGAMISSLSTFGTTFAAGMTGVVVAAGTAFQALRPAVVAEIELMTTEVITSVETPETGMRDRLATSFALVGELLGKTLSDSIIAGFVLNESLMILGLQDSLSRVMLAISTNLSTSLSGNSAGGTLSSVSAASVSRPALFTPAGVSNYNREIHYHLNVRTEATSQGVVQDYAIMQTMAAS